MLKTKTPCLDVLECRLVLSARHGYDLTLSMDTAPGLLKEIYGLRRIAQNEALRRRVARQDARTAPQGYPRLGKNTEEGMSKKICRWCRAINTASAQRCHCCGKAFLEYNW